MVRTADRRIKAPCLLLVEGSHDEAFVRAFLTHHCVESVQVIGVGGKAKLGPQIGAVARDAEWHDLACDVTALALGVLRDADDDAGGAFSSMADALARAGLPRPDVSGNVVHGSLRLSTGAEVIPVRAGALVIHGLNGTGALEDLCLASVEGHPVLECVDAFMACVAEHRAGDLKRGEAAKTRAEGFVLGHCGPGLHVGLAAHRECWPFDSPVFDDLKAFIRALAEPASALAV